MFKKITIIIFVLIIILLIIFFIFPWKSIFRTGTKNLVSGNGDLYVKGNKIYNRYNETFQLKGISSHGLQWYGELLTYDNLKYLRDEWKINVFRLALYTEEDGYISNPSLKDKLEEITDILIDLDMYVVIDWHILSDGNPMNHIDKSKEFFNDISTKYSNVPNILYEICNEPNGVSWKDTIKPYAEEIIPIIRNNSPKSIIIVGTPTWSTDIDKIIDEPLNFSNIAYSCHFYAGTHQTDARQKIERVLNKNLCVIITEWGTTNLTGNGELSLGSAKEWIDFLNNNQISYINWSFSNKNESSSILYPNPINTPEDIDKNLTQSGEFVKNNVSTLP